MKRIIYLSLLLVGVMFSSCSEDDPAVYDTDSLTDESIDFEVITFDNFSTTYTYPPSPAGTTDEVVIITALGAKPKGSDTPYTLTVSDANGVLAADGTVINGSIPAGRLKDTMTLTLNLDDLVLGQPELVTLTLDSDGLIKGKDQVQLTLGLCPTDLGGEYSAVTTGTSTDDCCPDPVTSMRDVTITDNGGANYTISDFSTGLYLDWYAVYGITEAMETDGTLSGTFVDACDQLAGTFPEPFGTDVNMTGSVDPSTGIITYTWTNGYNDTATVTLTPK